MDFPIENGDFPIENGDFPIENGDFPIENGDFPVRYVSHDQRVHQRPAAGPASAGLDSPQPPTSAGRSLVD